MSEVDLFGMRQKKKYFNYRNVKIANIFELNLKIFVRRASELISWKTLSGNGTIWSH
jgi:hypothetical protein